MSTPSDKTLLPLVKKLQLWAPLDQGDRDALIALPYLPRSLKAGQYLVWEGDRPQHACLLLAGFAFRHKIVAGGRRQILSVHMTGDVVDLHNSLLRIADHNVQMLTAGEVALMPLEAVVEIARARPAVGTALWYETLVDGSIFREWIANVGRRDARTRIAHLLCELALRLEIAGLGSRSGYELPMTQEQLADATGLTPVHVNRTLQALGADGLISRTKRDIRVADWAALAEVGDFNAKYLHVESAQGHGPPPHIRALAEAGKPGSNYSVPAPRHAP